MVDRAKKKRRDARRRPLFVRLLAVLVLLPLLALRVWDPSLVEALRVKVFDIYQVLAPRDTAHDQVVVVGVDDASLRALGQWPWPRTLVARLIETIDVAGATVIGIDIVFAEPDRFSPNRLVELFPNLGPELRAAFGRMARNDDVLAAAIDSAPVVLSRIAVADAAATDAPAPPPLRRAGDPLPHLFAFGGLLPNLPTLEAAAAAHGVVSMVPEGDGIVRRVPALVRIGDDIHPALSMEMLRLMQDAALTDVRAGAGGIEAVRVGSLTIPTDRTGRIWVRYGPRDTARTVSATAVLSGAVAPSMFAGRPVLVGVSAAALQDIKSTPVDAAMPGVEIHAQIIDGALSDALLRRPDFALALELVITLGIELLLVWLVPALGAAWTLLIGGVFAAALVAVSGLLFLRASILLDPSFPILATGLVFLFLVAANYLREEGQRREIRSAFARYLSPAVVERLVADPSQVQLGGETRELTILFCDIRGFTTISEGLKADPAALIQLVNMLLTP